MKEDPRVPFAPVMAAMRLVGGVKVGVLGVYRNLVSV